MPLDPQCLLLIDQLAAFDLDWTTLEPARVRALFAAQPSPPGPAVAQVLDRSLPGPGGPLPVRVYRPAGAGSAPLPALVYFHGGGFVLCNLDSHDGACRGLANAAGCAVVSVDYRLAPEHRFPAAPEDCYAATRFVAENAAALGLDPRRLAIGGDSAGGNLTAVVALMARDRGGPPLRFQLLIYPVTDCNFETRSYRENAEGYFLTAKQMRWFWEHYLSEPGEAALPYASPLRAEKLGGLPPALVITAEYDPLRDEGEAWAARLREAGVPVTLSRYDGMIHGFFSMAHVVDRARDAQAEAGAALRAAFGG
jgi:acetyl esterase